MTNLAQFAQRLAEEEHEVDFLSVKFLRMLVTEVYRNIMNNSPVKSGFYKANHVISIDGEPFDLKPPVKPTKSPLLAFVDLIPERRSKELAKVNSLRLDSIVVIGTSVFYAADVEARYGIYQLGLQEGTQRAIYKFKEGIRR